MENESNSHNTHAAINLPEKVAAKFRISGENARRRCHWRRHRNIDLNKISVEKAEKLVEQGFPYLVEKQDTAINKADESKSKKDK